MDKIQLRLKVARMVAKLTSTPSGRQYLQSNGYKNNQGIVAAGYDELIRDVMPRVYEFVPPVTIALVKGESELCMFTVSPSTQNEGAGAEVASPESTIGMLYEAGCQDHGKTFRINAWHEGATAVAMPSAAALLAGA